MFQNWGKYLTCQNLIIVILIVVIIIVIVNAVRNMFLKKSNKKESYTYQGVTYPGTTYRWSIYVKNNCRGCTQLNDELTKAGLAEHAEFINIDTDPQGFQTMKKNNWGVVPFIIDKVNTNTLIGFSPSVLRYMKDSISKKSTT
tara:strand:- start:1802 stop:2230 length:429 start_codon:yes stop_codon:yes gene_type:complete